MTTDLQKKVVIPPLVNEIGTLRSPDRQTTQQKRSRVEKQALFVLVSLLTDQLNRFDALGLLFRNTQLRLKFPKRLDD